MQKFIIKPCLWCTHKTELSTIRSKVFIQEQNVPEELEWDEYDESAQHAIALMHEAKPIGTGRIKTDGHIGRMAVLKGYRQQGIGSAILLSLLATAKKQNLKSVYLHAQVSAITFYEQHGFTCSSNEFLDAGIAHKSMIKKLK